MKKYWILLATVVFAIAILFVAAGQTEPIQNYISQGNDPLTVYRFEEVEFSLPQGRYTDASRKGEENEGAPILRLREQEETANFIVWRTARDIEYTFDRFLFNYAEGHDFDLYSEGFIYKIEGKRPEVTELELPSGLRVEWAESRIGINYGKRRPLRIVTFIQVEKSEDGVKSPYMFIFYNKGRKADHRKVVGIFLATLKPHKQTSTK